MSMSISVCLFLLLFWMNCACGHQAELKSSFSILSRGGGGGGRERALKGARERFLATCCQTTVLSIALSSETALCGFPNTSPRFNVHMLQQVKRARTSVSGGLSRVAKQQQQQQEQRNKH